MSNEVKEARPTHGSGDEKATGQGVFHVNDREGRVDAHGEELTGAEILNRVGLNSDRYQLFPLEKGKVGDEIKPTDSVTVKPGDHFRATLKGTDYSRG